MQFVRAHLNDAGWFQYGSYHIFDEQARNILDGKDRVFWIDDPSRTDLVQYPPAFPLWVLLPCIDAKPIWLDQLKGC